MSEITIPQAIEVFARGFCFTRSFTFPYLPEQLQEGLWVVRDAPRTRGDYRKEEFIGYGLAPETLDALAKRHTRGRYHLCAIRSMEESDTPLRDGFKALGYRLMTTEPFMVHSLEPLSPVREPVPIVRVTTREAADTLARAAGSRQILPEYLEADPPPMRQYMALDGEKPVGWVGSVAAAGCGWCTNLFVAPDYRRRGIGSALLMRMLHEDRAAQTRANVLLASHAGAKLYPTVGYQQIGELLAFVPSRSEKVTSDKPPNRNR